MELSDVLLLVPPLLFFYYLWTNRPRPEILSLFLLSGGLAASLKLFFRVVRDVGVDPFAFPSLHSSLASSLFFAVPSVYTLLYAVFVMVLRVVEGYHSPVDVISGFFVASLASLFYYSLKRKVGKEADRKSVHFGISVLSGFFGLFVDQLLIGAFLLMGATVLYAFRETFAPLFDLYGRSRGDVGPLSLALGLFIASVAGVLPLVGFVLGYVDGLSAVFGKLFGRIRLTSGKTFEGFLGGVLGSLVVSFLLRGFYPSYALSLVPFSALLEALLRSEAVDDNLILSVYVVGTYLACCGL